MNKLITKFTFERLKVVFGFEYARGLMRVRNAQAAKDEESDSDEEYYSAREETPT